MALYDVSTTEKKANPELVAGGTLYADSPIGTILPYGGATAPNGWFLCEGQALSRTTYSELFAVIGTSFGVGDGSTTFNLPDMRESVPKGAGLTGHTVGNHLDADGLVVGEFLDDRLQTGTINTRTNNGSFEYALALGSGSGSSTPKSMAGNFGYSVRTGDTTEVKSVGVNYIIKAKMVAVPADFMSKVDEVVKKMLSGTIDNSKFSPTVSTDITAQHNGIAYFSMTSISAMNVKKDGAVYFPGVDGAGTDLALTGTVFIEKGHTYNFWKYTSRSGLFTVNFIPFD